MKRTTVWTIVILIGAYVICQAIADVGATKFVQLGAITMPAGTFIFALTFTLRDLIHKRLGKEWARAAIVGAGLFNILQAFYLAGAAALPAPVWFAEQSAAWTTIFSIVPAITLGSIVAEIVSELVDTEVYHLTSEHHWPQWSTVLASNAVSLPLDSLIFGLLAFVLLPPIFGGDSVPFLVALGLVAGQVLWKGVVTVVSLPLIYLVPKKPLNLL